MQSERNCGSESTARTFAVRAAGRHHLTGALAAVAVAREMGLSTRQIAEGFSQFTPVEGRCHVATWDRSR